MVNRRGLRPLFFSEKKLKKGFPNYTHGCIMLTYNKGGTPTQREGDKDMKTFEIGNSYKTRSICDHECEWVYTVTKRTTTTVTLNDGKDEVTCRINKVLSERNGAETVYPMGRYSMAPTLHA